MSDAKAVYTGACLCGAVRFEARGDPLLVNHCHCVQCQRQSGAAVVTWATWPRASLRVLAGTPAEFESSPGVERSFCPRCGSTLFWRRERRASDPAPRGEDQIDVAAGTLDHADRLVPTDHIYVKSRRRWMPLCDGLPAFFEHRLKH